MTAAVVLARAPSAGEVLDGLAAVLSASQRAVLQAALVRHAAAWAQEVAGERAVLAVDPPDLADEVAALVDGAVAVEPQRGESHGERISASVSAAFERSGGPVLVARSDVPRLAAAHAAAGLLDIADGGQASFGPSMEGGWYLAALGEPRLELFELAAEAWDGPVVMARTLEIARRLDVDVGLLRMERALRTQGDLLAVRADPLTPPDVSRALRTGI